MSQVHKDPESCLKTMHFQYSEVSRQSIIDGLQLGEAGSEIIRPGLVQRTLLPLWPISLHLRHLLHFQQP